MNMAYKIVTFVIIFYIVAILVTCSYGNIFQLTECLKCSNRQCIFFGAFCNDEVDCYDKSDEQDCDNLQNLLDFALSVPYLEFSKLKAIEWIRREQDAEWGWKENTHRAVTALYLAGAMYSGEDDKEDIIIEKQLELEVFTHLLRRQSEKILSTELASYINALLVTCHDPRNFYGYNLISYLKEDINTNSIFQVFPYLALCNAKEQISEDAVNKLLKILKVEYSSHGFLLELQALAILALTCINNSVKTPHVERKIASALNNLKNQQVEDGSFGNEFTTALVLQALIANHQETAKGWNVTNAIKYLLERQNQNGSFGKFLTTYFIMPLLNEKTLLDVGKVNCTNTLNRRRNSDMILDIKRRLGRKIIVGYSLFIGDEKDQVHPLLLRIPENSTVLELMTLAAHIDPKYKYKTHEIKKKKYIYEIFNIPNDSENGKFWFIYKGSFDIYKDSVLHSEQSPDLINVYENDNIIMWYKTVDSL